MFTDPMDCEATMASLVANRRILLVQLDTAVATRRTPNQANMLDPSIVNFLTMTMNGYEVR